MPFAEALLAGRARAVIPDLLAHGDSPALPPEANLGTMADAIVALLDRLDLAEPLPVVAHSMGGRIALRLHERHPGRLGRLVLLDTPAGTIDERRSPLSPFLRALSLAPSRAATRPELLAPFQRVMMGDLLRAWMESRVVEAAEGFGWNFDRQALIDYRNNTLREALWDVVEGLGPGRLSVYAPRVSVYLRRAERARYEQCGIEVVSVEGARHDLYANVPVPVLEQIRAAVSP